MSVYKRPGAQTYSYDFQVGGHRFSGDTGKTTEREARREQERLKRQARVRVDAAKGRSGAQITVGAAFTRYMEEVGEYHVNAMTTLASLEWLQAHLGARRLLSTIDDNLVAYLVAKRRQEYRKVGNEKTPKKLVSAATVNRTCTEPLRKVLRRAADKWGAVVNKIDWAGHMLEEPQERVREASRDEEAAYMDQLDRGYEGAIAFATLTGCRRCEIVPRSLDATEERYKGLIWPRVDFFGRRITVVGKRGKVRTIPMSAAMFDLLWSLKDDHPYWVFTYASARNDPKRKLIRGVRYPITDAGLRTMMRRAVKWAGVENFRFHDLRHTAATRVLRKSNLRVVQNLLGHSDPSTTAKYAHALDQDIVDAMDAVTPTKIPTYEEEHRLNELWKKGKSS